MMKGLVPASAFVIQFRSPMEVGADRLSGRVEHVASGRTANFGSLEELPHVLLTMLRKITDEEGHGIG
jgi:hypothetical protein